jgi:hypothetical protein
MKYKAKYLATIFFFFPFSFSFILFQRTGRCGRLLNRLSLQNPGIRDALQIRRRNFRLGGLKKRQTLSKTRFVLNRILPMRSLISESFISISHVSGSN